MAFYWIPANRSTVMKISILMNWTERDLKDWMISLLIQAKVISFELPHQHYQIINERRILI